MTRDEKIATAKDLRAEGCTYKAIGEKLGVSGTTTRMWCNPREYERTKKKISEYVSARYATDPEYRARSNGCAKKHRESPEGKAKAAERGKLWYEDNRKKRSEENKAAYKRNKHARLTYFVEGAGLVKIGTTVNMTHRLKTLRIGSPVPLTLLGTTPIPEKELHKRFKHLRSHGEWFKPDDELRAFVAEHCTDGEA